MNLQQNYANRLRGFLVALILIMPLGVAVATDETVMHNAALVRAAFDAWRDGSGSVFDLLDDDVEWQVAGSSPVSGRYRSRVTFLTEAVQPINARLAIPITPTVRSIIAQDDAVVVIWDGVATTIEGTSYRNSYAWHLTFDEGRIVRVNAFLDTWALDRLFDRTGHPDCDRAGVRSSP